jgi:hypothetical protein
LLVQVPAAMGEIAVQWGRLVYGHVMSPAPKVCEHALAVFELGLSHMINVRKKILKSFLPDLKKVCLCVCLSLSYVCLSTCLSLLGLIT